MTTFKELIKDALPIIEKSAPTIGHIIGGAPGMATSFIVSMLAKTFGGCPDNAKELADKIMNDPSAEVKLQQLEKCNHDLLQQAKAKVGKPQTIEININMK